jgi:queuosine precursor transporter
MIGEAVDSSIFYPVAFLGMIPNSELLPLIISTWAVKVVWEVVALPVSVPVARMLKAAENEDVYDRNTNFNPLRF